MDRTRKRDGRTVRLLYASLGGIKKIVCLPYLTRNTLIFLVGLLQTQQNISFLGITLRPPSSSLQAEHNLSTGV